MQVNLHFLPIFKKSITFYKSTPSTSKNDKIWLRYREKTGYDKMYPSITGLELGMEDKSLIKQILECFLRLPVDNWGKKVLTDLLLTASFLRTWANSTLCKNTLETNSVTLRSIGRLVFTPLKCGWSSSTLEVKHKIISPYFLEIGSTLKSIVIGVASTRSFF